MAVSVTRSALNIQEKPKTTPKERTNRKIDALAALLHSSRTNGTVLRVLVGRLRHPDRAYTSKELETLLLLTVALQRAGMWP